VPGFFGSPQFPVPIGVNPIPVQNPNFPTPSGTQGFPVPVGATQQFLQQIMNALNQVQFQQPTFTSFQFPSNVSFQQPSFTPVSFPSNISFQQPTFTPIGFPSNVSFQQPSFTPFNNTFQGTGGGFGSTAGTSGRSGTAGTGGTAGTSGQSGAQTNFLNPWQNPPSTSGAPTGGQSNNGGFRY
jgi:hypothetical protein